MVDSSSTVQGQVELFRQHLTKILSSAEFANSRQARDFLLYVANAAFAGREHLQQSEIAENVLNRGCDFNPLDDASVRKVATLVRQKLERYQVTDGKADPVELTLPLRSYVPVFRLRQSSSENGTYVEHCRQANGHLETTLPKRIGPLYLVLGAVVLLVLIAVAFIATRQGPSDDGTDVFTIRTRGGDIQHVINDAPADSIRLGPSVSPVDDVDVRMKFSPEMASQQAGIMIFENADRYVKLGRQFTSRNEWEFGLETGKRYQKPPGTFIYDATGQDGTPVWLSIRRNHNIFEAFISVDGRNWRKTGNTLEMPDPMPHARVALYAYNGRTNAASTTATFSHLRVGPLFHDRDINDLNSSPIEGWTSTSNCGNELGTPIFGPDGLDFLFQGTPRRRCDWTLTRPIPTGNWSLQTRIDFQFHNGTIAGLIVSGKNGYLRLIRWDINNGSITAEESGHEQVSLQDFPGNPPITLRIECTSGVLRSSFSRDDRHFLEVPNLVNLSDLGGDRRIGIHTGVTSWVGTEPRPRAHFYYVQEEIRSLSNYR